MAAQEVGLVARLVHSEVEKINTVAGTVKMLLDRFSQRVKRVYRTVEELDYLRAERIDDRAKKTLMMRAHNVLVTAKKLVELDGEPIHLG